ncbi:hypothetical protein JW752_01780 [Candidatus Peregrinibacteria bacterium]|nr:hypothetical protein [Candidatus Peregrinibacteria bacterium]
MTKNLFVLTFVAMATIFASQASAKEAEFFSNKVATEKPSKIMQACVGNYTEPALQKVCSSMESHTKMTIRLIEKAVELYGKQASKEDIIQVFEIHISVVKSLNLSAMALSTNGQTNHAKQGIFAWHNQVMDKVRDCIEKDKTLIKELFALHAEAAKVLFE